MKRIKTLSLCILIACLAACQSESDQPVDLIGLQQTLDKDANVQQFRNMSFEGARIMASFTLDELKAAMAKARSCGFYASEASLPDLENCLAGFPKGADYFNFEKTTRESVILRKHIEQLYPELMKLDQRIRIRAMLGVPNERQAAEILAVQKSKHSN